MVKRLAPRPTPRNATGLQLGLTPAPDGRLRSLRRWPVRPDRAPGPPAHPATSPPAPHPKPPGGAPAPTPPDAAPTPSEPEQSPAGSPPPAGSNSTPPNPR